MAVGCVAKSPLYDILSALHALLPGLCQVTILILSRLSGSEYDMHFEAGAYWDGGSDLPGESPRNA